VSDPKFA
jgi:hypothetical protein